MTTTRDPDEVRWDNDRTAQAVAAIEKWLCEPARGERRACEVRFHPDRWRGRSEFSVVLTRTVGNTEHVHEGLGSLAEALAYAAEGIR